MADTMTKEQRSRCMAAVKGKDTKPELLVRRYLFSRGLRFRLHVRDLPGSPDIVLPKYRTVIFVDGCFWHGHEGCRHYRLPKTNTDFWREKIERNKARDRRDESALEALGWRVLRVWECDLRAAATRPATLSRLHAALTHTVTPRSNTVPPRSRAGGHVDPTAPLRSPVLPSRAPVRPYTDDTPTIPLAAEPETE